ncbi:formimidoylglutamate deiminase [Thetidibacter halocola]|uniref:Formimidoylglutamate deiminase n=1 Tax=Thetidibacter halocola TaxID=2827239 RepID=A0A8J7WAK5_9RHOB|nr:formimidoylglutamate deiminase [Thetidibacter halocola]MBS0124060.1 formimidoylglutamate deiminase [Thetidibacter halocola]
MIHARIALLPEGWGRDVRLALDAGRIASVQAWQAPQPGDCQVDCLLPGMPNVHSHAFQRGFSGMTERRGPGQDSFWTWREAMYRLALALDPDDMQALAEMAYVEMLEAGFTRVGEFHYLHHDRSGRPHADPAEMSVRIFAAAGATGIALTHLPVFYAHGGFGPVPAGDGQRRFLHGLDDFVALVEACDRLATRPQDVVGYAPHSLRAASTDELRALAQALHGRPAHIHVAEQEREVAECLAFCGRRPVAQLMDTVGVGPDWCLIHATHLDGAERLALVGSGAVAGLCPVTEANLGDGLFAARAFLAEGGRIAIGTDSNVAISVAGELRLLEYGQRLAWRARSVLAEAGGSTGARLYRAALAGGSQALGAPDAAIAPGAPADLVTLSDALGLGQSGETMLDRWIFGRDVGVAQVWAHGAQVVRDGRHIAREAVARRFADVMRRLA